MPRRLPRIPTEELRRFISIVRRLRRECPWDRRQTHRSIRHSLIEEAYEVVEALDAGNAVELRRELGDLLLHVVMHGVIAEQAGEFTLAEVVGDVTAKLIRRHPHIFKRRTRLSADQVRGQWERLKLREGRTSLLDGVPVSLPALQRAERVQERAGRVGFQWDRTEQVWRKVQEELREFKHTLARPGRARREAEFGDFLFALVNYARYVGVHPENALRGTTDKFIRRFRYIERSLARQGRDPHRSTLREMDALWEQAKRRGL
ncbi:MAG: nucleoside triphosphate pyrophosphohydrolase [Bacteroidota bacterium]